MSIFTFSKNSFEGQLPGEKTILLIRKHWLNLAVPLLLALILAFLPFIIYLLINSLKWYGFISSFYWFLVTVYFLVLWNLAFYNIMIYFLNTIIVTNKRLVENRQEGFFRHTINELELTRIQDISVKVFGPLAEFLDFGNIEIQTAGTEAKFAFSQLPHPRTIKNTIMSLKREALSI